MRNVHLLLGGAERGINRVVEASVLDACYDHAAVETTNVNRLGQFSRHGAMGSYDLMILVPDCLLPEPNLGGGEVPLDHALSAVRSLKSQSTAPLIVLTANPSAYQRYLEAGADAVVTEFFQADRLKSEVRRLLGLPDPAARAEPDGWSLAALFLRGLGRLKRA